MEKRLTCIVLCFAVLFSIGLVSSDHIVKIPSGEDGFFINDSTISSFNISINNTYDGPENNITQAIVVIPSEAGCSYLDASNDTNSSGIFSNDTIDCGEGCLEGTSDGDISLSWNSSNLINTSDKKYFSFNLTCQNHGFYETKIFTLNQTANILENEFTNLSVLSLEINDTASFDGNLTYPSNGSTISSDTITLNHTADGTNLNCTTYVWDSDGVLAHSESTVGDGQDWSSTSIYDDGIYLWNVDCHNVTDEDDDLWLNSSNLTFTVANHSFYGYVMNSSNKSQGMNNTNITFTIYDGMMPDDIYATYETQSVGNGWFNISSISLPSSFLFDVDFVKYNDSDSGVYVGPSNPKFFREQLKGQVGPGGVTERLQNNTFYLRQGALINITTVNEDSESHEHFSYYQVKEKDTGFLVKEKFIQEMTDNFTAYLPADKNYTVMIAPNGTLPVNTQLTSEQLSDGYYNYTFNTTENPQGRLTGYVNTTSGANFTSLHVLVYLLDQGRMIFLGDHSGSAFLNITEGTDEYNLTTGFYNISTIGIAENSEAIVMPVAFVNHSGEEKYYSGFKNVNLDFDGPSPGEINFTNESVLQEMRGETDNISVDTFGNAPGDGPGNDGFTNLSAAKFNLNVDYDGLPVEDSHIEIRLDYSSLGMTNFTFVTNGPSASIPLLKNAGIKRVNVFSRTGAPLKKTLSNASLADLFEYNLTLDASMGGIDPESKNPIDSLFIDKIELTPGCFVPNYNASECSFFGGEQENINPFAIVMSGARLSFVMRDANNITVMYKNVDLVASGPPNIAFDSSPTDSGSVDTFAQAWKFGSSGPEIYDEVIIGIPYTPGSESQTGFDEDSQINLTIKDLYDADYNSIWNFGENTSASIENATVESELYHFKDYLGTEYETYLNGSYPECNESDENLSSGLCYKDKENDMVWFRIPHFSGVGAGPSGDIITADSGEETTSSPSSGGGGRRTVSQILQKIHAWGEMNPGEISILKDFKKGMGVRQIQISVGERALNVKITVRKHDSRPTSVATEKSGKVNKYLEIDTQNLDDSLEKATLTIQVNRTWVSENELDRNDVGLFRYNENSQEWDELMTDYIDSDEDFHYYDTELTGFSFFAIGERSVKNATSGEDSAQTDQEDNTNDISTESTSPEADNEEKISSGWSLFVILLALVLIGVLSYLGYKMTKKAK